MVTHVLEMRRGRAERVSRDKSQETRAGRTETSEINCDISDPDFCEGVKSNRARCIIRDISGQLSWYLSVFYEANANHREPVYRDAECNEPWANVGSLWEM